MVTLEESIPILSLSSTEGLEVVTFQICYNQVDITMCGLYIVPNSDLSYLQSLLLYLSHLPRAHHMLFFLVILTSLTSVGPLRLIYFAKKKLI